MSRAAQEVQRQVEAMRAAAAKSQRQARPSKERDNVVDKEVGIEDGGEDYGGSAENQLTEEAGRGMNTSTETGRADAAEGNSVTAADAGEGEANVAKTKTGKKSGGKKSAKTSETRAAKAAKTPKAPKAPKAAKAEKTGDGAAAPRQRRVKVVSGALTGVEAMGTTYLKLQFEEGHIVLTPTGNREPNRDMAVKALRAALKLK